MSTLHLTRWLILSLLIALGAGLALAQPEAPNDAPPADAPTIRIGYLEMVTPDVDATCALLEKIHGVRFGDPVPTFGGARTAALADGGRLGVRGPLRETEEPVVRPYLLVDDIEGAIEAAGAAGAEIAIPPMELPGEGTFAIYILGGIEHGLWQD